MKTMLAKNRARVLGSVLTLAAMAFLTSFLHANAAPDGQVSKEGSTGLAEQLKKWQGKMSETFRNGFSGIRNNDSGTQLSGSVSADLREQNDSYTLRLSLPDRDLNKVQAYLEGTTLHVVAPEDGKLRRYEQSILLGDVAPSAKLQIDRKPEDELIMITIPKPFTARVSGDPAADNHRPGPLHWDRDNDTMERMRQMQHEMDRIFQSSFKPFSLLPDFSGIFDEPRFGSSYTMEEQEGSYVVRAYLPDRNMRNVNVTVESQTLKIEAKAEKDQAAPLNEKEIPHRMSQFTQLITLPGPVAVTQMKVESKEGMVIVTVPKSASK